jgi:hypothetical protein
MPRLPIGTSVSCGRTSLSNTSRHMPQYAGVSRQRRMRGAICWFMGISLRNFARLRVAGCRRTLRAQLLGHGMATKGDDPKKKKQDAKLVSQQPHEQKYLQKTTGKTAAQVKAATTSAGPSRKAVLKKLGK